MSEIVYQKAQTHDIHRLNHFLKQHQQASASRGDFNYLTKELNAIVGCARLIKVESSNGNERSFWLRGVFVREEQRRQGIATQLLEFMHQDLLQQQTDEGWSITTCFAFPLAHLNGFYEALGYEHREVDSLPPDLQQRYRQAMKAGKKWLCMMKTIEK